MNIIFNDKTMVFKDNTFYVNEKDTPAFTTTYKVINPKTGKSAEFELSHSTGSEWDPKTIWIYKNKELGLELHVSQDPNITIKRANNYLHHKTKQNEKKKSNHS